MGYSGPRYRSRDRSSSVSPPNDAVRREIRLADDMWRDLEGRSKFTYFRTRHFQAAGRLLSMDGFLDWGFISELDEQKREYLREYLRYEGVTAIQLSLVNEIFNRYENEKPPRHDPPRRKTAKGTKFEELVIPTKMRRWSADLSYLDAFVKPDQDKVNLFTKEFSISGKRALRPPLLCAGTEQTTAACPISVTRAPQ